jgi:ketosteroid isomerase-like protein
VSQENVEVVRKIYSDMTGPDYEAGAEHLAAGIEWDTRARGSDGSIVYVVGSVVKVSREWLDAWEDVSFELREIREARDQVAVWMVQHGRGRGSGIAGELVWFASFRFSDAKVISYREYESWSEALKVVGLEDG